ncbi:EamA family transporter RarD [Coralliovum pocilloporae]|uniref:EamA family transporter RarD n=1 Tax=Coralliovum pocilloporae TaxID=3066369 RepID=UPI0033077169
MSNEDRMHSLGLAAAASAFTIWGLSVIFFKFQAHIPAHEVIAHRIVWSVVFVGLYLAVQRRGGEIVSVLRNRRLVLMLLVSSLLVATNWLLFVWAVGQGKILETSYGYFINPLTIILLSFVVLKEKLSPPQWLAVGLAFIAVLVQGALLSGFPWISIAITVTFALYGLMRKQLDVGANLGLFVEALLLSPLALGYLLLLEFGQSTSGHFGASVSDTMLLMANGPVTATPLILFAYAARRLKFSTVGLLQYITPSLSFLLAVLIYGEPLNTIKLVSFVIIWVSLVVFTWDLLRKAKQPAQD